MWMDERGYKLWLTGKGDGVGAVKVMVKELCEEVVEVRRVSDSDGSTVSLSRGCTEADLWACSTKCKKF